MTRQPAPAVTTPEYTAFINFVRKHGLECCDKHVPFSERGPARVTTPTPAQVEATLAGQGSPLIIANALQDLSGVVDWDWEQLRAQHGSRSVLVNNRAPARHADAMPGGGGPQRTILMPLAQYIDEHVDLHPTPAPNSSSPLLVHGPAPLYLNGWRLFSETAEPLPEPAWCQSADQTLELAVALDVTLFKGAGSTSKAQAPPSWAVSLNRALSKLFLGPTGTVTRLHCDAGAAHGWLAQVAGRKLFVLLPPSASNRLHLLDGEPETAQSPVDPLEPDLGKYPAYAGAKPLACILEPGEAIIIPQGWWHYAAALTPSITLQRNFYHSGSNVKGLVAMVLKTAAGIKAGTPSGHRQ